MAANNLDEETEKSKNDSPKTIVSLDDIKSLDKYFQNLINLIPAKIYFNENEEIIDGLEKNKKRKFEHLKISTKSKQKRSRLDRDCNLTVSEVAKQYSLQSQKNVKLNKLRKKLSKRIKELKDLRTSNKNSKLNDEEIDSVEKSSPDFSTKTPKSPSKTPNILNKQGDLVFSRFDLNNQVDLIAEKAIDEDIRKNKQGKKSLKGLLFETKRNQEKISHLEQTSTEAASKFKEKILWKNVLEKSEGNKLRDDPKLIEKSLKKRKKIKQKRREAWEEKRKNLEKSKKFKQEKRQRNLDKRKQKKRDKKLKRLQAKGRIPDAKQNDSHL
ncbi:surfeit locus protein 6-like protein [Sarcoptes scabiei]|uniref:Surfeit locus protein 6-like protein n=1 Tax=Sarcoptes scabiei TaxID=52283 RepID=A0A132ACZ1_SARSC|nr:surfeit locus protein 6-like protein [Sarcoptes scabiei]